MPDMDANQARFILDKLTTISKEVSNLTDEGDIPAELGVAIWGISAQLDIAIKILDFHINELAEEGDD